MTDFPASKTLLEWHASGKMDAIINRMTKEELVVTVKMLMDALAEVASVLVERDHGKSLN